MKRLIAFVSIGTFIAVPAMAQSSDPIAAYEQRIAEQQEQLDQMRRELDELKSTVADQAIAVDKNGATPDPQVESKPPEPFVTRKNEDLSLKFSGRVHRMLLSVNDGANTDLFFTDSEQGPTMLRFDATGKASESITVGATIETGIRQNRPFLVSQDNPSAGTSVNVRMAEIFINDVRFGKLSLGRGFGAGWFAPEMDLSGTQFASLLPVGMLAPGFKFVDASDNSLSDIRVRDHFADVERMLLVDRIRYDSPQFGPGLQVSSSIANSDRWDVALRYKPKATQDWTVVAGASFQNKPFVTIDKRQDAVISVRHNQTGLNLTLGGSVEKLTAGRDANTFLIKGGWLTDIFSLGHTAFSLDYFIVNDLRLAEDEAKSFGLFAVQKWPTYGLDFYAGYRKYDVARPDIVLRDLDLLSLGVAFNF